MSINPVEWEFSRLIGEINRLTAENKRLRELLNKVINQDFDNYVAPEVIRSIKQALK